MLDKSHMHYMHYSLVPSGAVPLDAAWRRGADRGLARIQRNCHAGDVRRRGDYRLASRSGVRGCQLSRG